MNKEDLWKQIVLQNVGIEKFPTTFHPAGIRKFFDLVWRVASEEASWEAAPKKYSPREMDGLMAELFGEPRR